MTESITAELQAEVPGFVDSLTTLGTYACNDGVVSYQPPVYPAESIVSMSDEGAMTVERYMLERNFASGLATDGNYSYKDGSYVYNPKNPVQ